MSSLVAQQRQALVDALLSVGPIAPTLNEGWTSKDLAAHLVARERRPDSLPGIGLPGLARWTEHVRRSYLEQSYEDLIELVRTGPGTLSPFALPMMDELANLSEFFIHTEDVRRGSAGWTAAPLEPELADELWRRLRVMARLQLRGAKVPVRLVGPDGREIAVGPDGRPVRLIGNAGELTLWLSGRKTAVNVILEGDPIDIATLEGLDNTM